MVARITGTVNRLEVAEAAAGAMLSSRAASVTDWANMARVGLALIAVQQVDAEAAEGLYAALESQRGTMLFIGMIVVDRVLGLVCVTQGRLDQAIVHFEDANSFCRKAGYRPELAWTCCDYAAMLIEAPRPAGAVTLTDRQKASTLLVEALSISTELGMRPLKERVVALRDKVQPQPAKRPQLPDGLTEREVEVLLLIAEGKSNLEISRTLFISTNTVANRVGRILSKIGSANRTEAARYAVRRGLAS